MVFEELLEIVAEAPVFETGLLLTGDVNPDYLRRQLSQWVNEGKLWQLRRGLYALAPPYQQTAPHPFHVANRMRSASYVSLQSALSYHSLIPEHVAAVTSVTTRRPGEWRTPVAHFIFRHIQPALLFGYEQVQVDEAQQAFVATPSKALLDLVYLQPGGDAPDYLASLRLQNMDTLDLSQLHRLAAETGKPKLQRAADVIAELAAAEEKEYESL